MTEEEQFVIQDLSELLQIKSPRGVLILEGDLKTWKAKEDEGGITRTWDEALDYIRRTCDGLNISYFSLQSTDFQRMKEIENRELKALNEDWIRNKSDISLYVAGCLCCAEARDSYFNDLEQLKELLGGLDRVFVAASPGGQNAPRGWATMSYTNDMPKNGYFLV